MSSFSDFLLEHGIEPKTPVAFTSTNDHVIPAGARNETLTAIMGILRKAGFAPNIAQAALRGIGTDPLAIAEPMDVDEIDHIAREIANRASQAFDTSSLTIETVDVDAAVIPPLKWLVHGFLPAEGLTLVFGLPAQGKSYVALDLARVCLTGGIWINGGKAAKVSRVGYFDWERRGAMFKRRALSMMRGQGVVIDYVTVKRPLAQAIDDIIETVRARGYELVIIDSLSIAIMTGDLMQAHEVIPRMFALHELGIPIVLLDHMAKPQPGTNPQYASAYGSMFKEAIVSCAWHVMKPQPTARTKGYMDFRLMPKKNNFDKGMENIDAHLLLEENERGEITRAEIKPGFFDAVPPETSILEAMQIRDESTIRDIANTTGFSTTFVRNKLHDAGGLIDQGVVRVVRPGGDGRGNAAVYALDKWADSERPA